MKTVFGYIRLEPFQNLKTLFTVVGKGNTLLGHIEELENGVWQPADIQAKDSKEIRNIANALDYLNSTPPRRGGRTG